MTNTYSEDWFSIFLDPMDAAQTEVEVAFLTRNLPRPRFYSILDLCCGGGRHAQLLARQGYAVTGVDVSSNIIDRAKACAGENERYIIHDMRHIGNLPGSYDAVINLWQSFGYFDAETNQDILRQIAHILNPGDRLILDLYHRGFFEQHQGVRTFEREGVTITEHKRMFGDRLEVELAYGRNGKGDMFDWQLFTPATLVNMVEAAGFHCLITCAEFDEAVPASTNVPRMQSVFEKSGEPLT